MKHFFKQNFKLISIVVVILCILFLIVYSFAQRQRKISQVFEKVGLETKPKKLNLVSIDINEKVSPHESIMLLEGNQESISNFINQLDLVNKSFPILYENNKTDKNNEDFSSKNFEKYIAKIQESEMDSFVYFVKCQDDCKSARLITFDEGEKAVLSVFWE